MEKAIKLNPGAIAALKMPEKAANSREEQLPLDESLPGDVFGIEDGHDIKYKTLSWPLVAGLMITEIVSTGLLTLPNTLATVGVVPGVIIIAFLGAFTTYTAWSLIQFKLQHPTGKYFFKRMDL
ncbi:hypothetical protein O1611_g7355 [Lasiodiplodia mahajangana]|uniref:Uncharacterized protein n=1 Tax=Lasiodiplodia mahajangana TaxID=1108764 RepID=A0ACC2JGC9_9PEZI|nr:hypothetical protein O1611_g7355 [Lasiodiplodia mahajangana]